MNTLELRLKEMQDELNKDSLRFISLYKRLENIMVK